MNNPYARSGYAPGWPSSDPAQGNVIVDRPRPSAGFVCSFLAFPLVILGLLFGMLGITYLLTGGSTRAIPAVSAIFIIVFVIGLTIFIGLLLIGFSMKYILDEQALRLSTAVRSLTIPLNSIVYGEKTSWNRRLMGWGPFTVGICNRWTNGLCLTVNEGRQYFVYLTPSDPDAFLAHVRAFKEHAAR